MNAPLERNVDVPVATVRPRGDLVVIERIDDADAYMRRTGLWIPKANRRGKPAELRMGNVIATGPGDRLLEVVCADCGTTRVLNVEHKAQCYANMQKCYCGSTGKCKACGSVWITAQAVDFRRTMEVKPGDTVFYWRVPANDVMIDSSPYVFIHEEQHIEAVIEEVA